MESVNYHSDLALLDWQVELGATEAICDAPVNRYELPDQLAKPKAVTAAADSAIVAGGAVRAVDMDVVAAAQAVASRANTLDELRAALLGFEHCDLKKGARNLVFSDGVVGARVMFIGEAPGRDEDREGRPFVGAVGQLFDKMLAAIDLSRLDTANPAEQVYISTVLPWRPPQDRDPRPDEIAMMRPFLLRHIALAKPEALVIFGNWSCQALLGKRGITRLRGEWTEVEGILTLPMLHPAALMRNSAAKREAWADLLNLKAKLRKGG